MIKANILTKTYSVIQINKLQSDKENFIKIFQVYPIGDSSLTHNPVKMLQVKHDSLVGTQRPKMIKNKMSGFSKTSNNFFSNKIISGTTYVNQVSF